MTGRSGKRRLALFPASFDPITNGHLDLIQRSRSIFDEVVLALARNVSKTAAFSTEEVCAQNNVRPYKLGRFQVKNLTGEQLSSQYKFWKSKTK